ncbi:unnamed protein product [Mytilus coruscus]|uniref:Mutator-like transposase domain-containing protein n=1 Tax=Mytilus coruscus TaxID=42192 RepID=A0A6J8EDC3_MYTCO|nr:unnamed protein product [Mytilus coruscus]
MARKIKISKKFDRSLGRHRQKRREKHKGRPIYRIKKSRQSKNESLKLKIRKIHMFYNNTIHKNTSKASIYASFATGCDLKLKIRKVKDLSSKGYRSMNLDCLQSHISDITIHVCLCVEAMKVTNQGKPPITLETEVLSFGLASVMLAQCQGCQKKFTLDSSSKVPGSKRFDINVRAVWGSMVTGNGPSHLNEFLSTLNSPGLSHPSFTAIETAIGQWWHSILEKDMLSAGQEERLLAIDRNDYHEEVSAITVITDGVPITLKNTLVFKNWDKDSQSMESDVILQGFLEAERKHGVRYMRIVGDGDSSVFAKIREEVPGWGRSVKQEECANHVSKCYRSNLEKLVTDNPLYKGRHHLSKTTRVRLVCALRCAIRVRSKDFKEKK